MKKYETVLFSAVGLAVLFILLVAVNYLASGVPARADFTDGKLYTLSEGTKKVLQKLDGPVKVRLYVSQSEIGGRNARRPADRANFLRRSATSRRRRIDEQRASARSPNSSVVRRRCGNYRQRGSPAWALA